MNKALVLDINEIYRVIPETKGLEGKNFKDVRELLKDLISAIESSGRWQFIQYVTSKPSLFIVREESADAVDASKLKQQLKKLIAQAEADVKTIKDTVPGGFLAAQAQAAYIQPTTSKAKDVYSDEKFEETAAEVSNLGESLPVTKLPWE